MSLQNIEAAREQIDKLQKMQRYMRRLCEAAVHLASICEEEKYFASRDNMRKVIAIARREKERLAGSERAAERYLTMRNQELIQS